jgi:glycosyltransferase involved in cell wall biosynthesis
VIPARTLVSVIMPAYEPDRDLMKRAVHSVLNQSHLLLELLIVDDGCSMPLTVDEFDADQRIKIIRLNINSGRSAARNAGIAAANGDFIAIADADDIQLPKRFEQQLRAFRLNPEVDLLGMNMVYHDGRPVSPVFSTSYQLRFAFLFRNALNFPTLMFKRHIVSDGIWFDETLKRAEDYDWLIRVSRKYVVFSIPSTGTLYNYQADAPDRAMEKNISESLRFNHWKNTFPELMDAQIQAFMKLGLAPGKLQPADLDELYETANGLIAYYQQIKRPFQEDFKSVVFTTLCGHVVFQKYAGRLLFTRSRYRYLFRISEWPWKVKMHILRKLVLN